MLKNGRLARVISDAGFGDFIRMLEYKCKWYGRTLVKVDTFFPVLPIVKVVLHLPCQERRTQVARPLAMSKLPDGPPAGRKRRRQSVCRGLENLSRGTLGDSLWRHGKT